jgi:hypothetical protein
VVDGKVVATDTLPNKTRHTFTFSKGIFSVTGGASGDLSHAAAVDCAEFYGDLRRTMKVMQTFRTLEESPIVLNEDHFWKPCSISSVSSNPRQVISSAPVNSFASKRMVAPAGSHAACGTGVAWV